MANDRIIYGDALFEKIENEMKSGKIVIAELAPAVRVALGELFGFPVGTNVEGKAITLLKKLGFQEVVDTPLGADISTYYEAEDLKERLDNGGGKFPIFNSCCIGWRMYAGKMHPELLGNITIVASPQMTIGAVAKYYFAEKLNRKPEDIIIVGVMPCALKKYETLEVMRNGNRYVDYVVTTVELAQWAKKKGIDFNSLPEDKFSSFMPNSSKDGVVFGATGGVTEAIITTLAQMYGEKIEITDFRDNGEIRKKTVKIGKHILNIAIVHGLPNFEKLYEEIKAGQTYHLVEIMMCPFGCVGGPGQPPASKENIQIRAKSLRQSADSKKEKTPLDNETFIKIKKEFLDKLDREKLYELIYFNR
ncbi:MAG: [Fe-Fe] hydrogenase large subunit C-terminal domain-containing protein [Candidatus Bilamarchaeaceae archaeon]